MRQFAYRLRLRPMLAALFCTAAIFAATLPATAQSPCTCRAAGTSFALDACTCLKTPDGPRVACCGKVLNNTAWHFTAQPCPSASVPVGESQPRIAGLVPDAQTAPNRPPQIRWQAAAKAN